MNILYQPYLYHEEIREGPFKYIESGYIDGFKKNGCDVAVWGGRDLEHLEHLLSKFRPDIFVGYLRGAGEYKNFPWVSGPLFEKLKNYRQQTGMRVALHTHPDVQELAKHLQLVFVDNDPSNAGKFYSQPPPPTPAEQKLVDEAFIDVILHSYSAAVTQPCFAFWLSNEIRVVEEPLALDDVQFKPPLLARFKKYDVSYVGGWWPFKGMQLDRFLLPMSDYFGSRLVVYGKGWPHLARGYVSDARYCKIVWQSRINLVFHEPSQVQGQPVHVNERIFKIYGMGGFAICDDNPCLREYFSEDELVTASCPEEMIEKAKYYLQHPKERESIARRGHRAVLQRHTYAHRARHLLDTLT